MEESDVGTAPYSGQRIVWSHRYRSDTRSGPENCCYGCHLLSMGMEQFNPLKRPAHVISKQFRSTSMCISQIGRLSRWGLGIFLAAGLMACGASDQRDAVLPSAGALGADTAIVTGQPTATAQASVT